MTVALVVAAIALALVCGILLGLGWYRRGPGAHTVSTPIPNSVTTTEQSSSAPPVVAAPRVIPANAPREVAPTAELRDSDVAATTGDGRMTKAGLLGLIVRNTEVAVAVVDQFRDVVLYNEQAIELGMVRDRLLADAVWDAAKDVLDTETEKRFEFSPPSSALGFVSTGRATAKAVDSVRCLVRLVAHDDERYAVVYGQDDTEHSRVEATRRDFVANVSHELKTPVGAIGLLTEALLESSDDPDSVEYFGQRVITETNRMGKMVSELIALSRLQGGETSAFETVDIDALIDDALDSATVSAGAAGIVLRADDASGLTVRGDRPLLLTALNNLIVNAIVYSSANTTVSVSRRITTVEGRPMVAIAVTDRGLGIAAEDQERVFERFFRVDKARSRQTGGTGLGLAIVKHVAANHGGSIGLWSKPGTGSTFTLQIPQDLTADLVDDDGRDTLTADDHGALCPADQESLSKPATDRP